MNHPTDRPVVSSFFSHRPATVGSAALLGSAALVSITTLAMNNIDSRVFKGVSPLREVYGHRLTICPFQGHSACNRGAFGPRFRRNVASIRENLAPVGTFSVFMHGDVNGSSLV
jgi:hypothetical protein